jgi:hypothetical protein
MRQLATPSMTHFVLRYAALSCIVLDINKQAKSTKLRSTTDMTFSLNELRELAGEYGDSLEQIDCDYANEILAQGNDRDYVIDLAEGWAHEMARVERCEAKAALDFEQDAY